MNGHDSERMLSILTGSGYTPTENPKDAEVIIVNTCSVRGKAEQKAYSSVGRYVELKKLYSRFNASLLSPHGNDSPRKQDKLIVFSGCVAQQNGRRLLGRFKDIDLIVGPSQVHRIDELIDQVKSQVKVRTPVVAIESDTEQKRFRNPVQDVHGVKAYVTIMEGCDNFCTYCTVPYLRGREVSRQARSIIDEAYALAGSGVKEIILLGQNVNSYRDDSEGGTITLYELLSMLNDIKGLERIRFITSHPKDLTDKLIRAFVDFDKVCEHIHLPVQSGSDRILKLMARGYTTRDYRDKIEMLMKVKPDIAVTSDFIVGFPSETEDDHKDSILFIKHANYDNIFSFRYSDRPLAKAGRFENKIDAHIIAERLMAIQSEQLGITRRIYGSLVGTIQHVLVEGKSKKPDRIQGRTRQGRIVNFEGSAGAGALVEVMIEDYSDNALYGRCIKKEEQHVH